MLIRNIKNIWGKMIFRKKIISIFLLVFMASFGLFFILQTLQINKIRYNESKANLALLCEQTGINFSEEMDKNVQWLYSALYMHDVPLLLRDYSGNSRDIQSAMSRILQSTSPFDFLMILTKNGDFISETKGWVAQHDFYEEAQIILSEHGDCGYGIPKWYRSLEGEVYLLWDIYQISPLSYRGRILAHISRDNMFMLGDRSKELEYVFLFYTLDEDFLYATGADEDTPFYGKLSELEAAAGEKIKIQGKDYFITFYKNGYFYNVGLIPIEHIRNANILCVLEIIPYGILLFLIGCATLIVCLRFMMVQLDNVTQSMIEFASGNIEHRAEITSEDDIGCIAEEFNKMAEKIENLIDNIKIEKRRKMKVEFELLKYHYRSLQTQLNPHFVFNALEMINAKAKMQGQDDLSKDIVLLSRYFRMVTTSMNQEFITVAQEFSNMKDYTDIYINIYEHTLNSIFVCQKEVEKAMIPVMTVQPVLENAFIHGINGIKGEKVVRVEAKTNAKDKLLIIVENSGRKYSEDNEKYVSESPGIGLKNIRERLKLLYGTDASVTIEGYDKGTRAIIMMPLDFELPLNIDMNATFEM